MNRRQFLGRAAAGAVALSPLARALPAAPAAKWKVSMYQGSLRVTDPTVFDLAKRIGLDGVEVLMGPPEENLPVRQASVRKQYKEASRRAGVTISSVCINALNRVALKSEPKTALWLLDTIEACADFGCRNILVPFFSNGELKMENADEVTRVVDALKELAPRAAKAGVVLGLENTLSADDNMSIVERVGAPSVRVYYDIGNSAGRGRDVAAEMRKLGSGLICQIHIKDNPNYLGEGKIDLAGVAAAINDIGYTGWLVLETVSPSKNVEEDTRRNVAFLKKTFGMA